MSKFLLSAGSNARGQLSNGSTDDSHQFRKCSFYGYPSRTLPPQTHRIIQITAGANHTVALLEMCNEGGKIHLELWGCGDGSSGQLGDLYWQSIRSGESPAIFRPIVLSLDQEGLEGYYPKLVSACWETTYVVLECEGKGDVLISMGADHFGDLGVGDLKPTRSKEKGPKSCHIVDFRHLILEELSLDLDTVRIIIQSLNAGQHHVIARAQIMLGAGQSKMHIMGWGASRHGQLGTTISKTGRHLTHLSMPTLINTGNENGPIISIALGSQHTVFLHASGKVSSLGSNRKGQLHGLENAQSVVALGCTWNGTYLLVQNDDGIVHTLATGNHVHGQLGRKLGDPASMSSLAPVDLPSVSTNMARIACGTEHVLALAIDESKGTCDVWGWGWNEHGNLGTGKTNDVLIPRKIWPTELEDEGQKAVSIWAGCGTSWICSVIG